MPETITERARGRWPDILRTLGIPSHFLNGKHQPCPMCGGKDRARFDDKNGSGSYICSQCGAGNGVMLLRKFFGWTYEEAAQRIEAIVGTAKLNGHKAPLIDERKRDAMNRLWKASSPLRKGDPVEVYLATRGIALSDFPAALRHNAGEPPCMVAMVRAHDGRPCTLHRTYIVSKQVGFKAVRKLMPGALPPGAAVRVSEPNGETLGIAEGIETAFSATQLTGIPCWAALNEGRLVTWQPPAKGMHIHIFADNDENFVGQAAAYVLAKRLVRDKFRVTVRVPLDAGQDWNDVLRQTKTSH